MNYSILGLGVFVLIFLSILLIPRIFQKFKKCDKCGKRINKQYITGQYGSGWYECKCNYKK